MDEYHVYTPNPVKKVLKKIPWDWQLKIRAKLIELETKPYLGVPMQGKYSDKRKITIWPYRIVYFVNEAKKLIEVKEIESRGNVSYDR